MNIEIHDELHDIIERVKAEVTELLFAYLDDEPYDDEPTSAPCLNNALDYDGSVSTIIDSAVPVYTAEIDDIFYLHRAKVEDAFDNAGLGSKNDDDWPNGWRAAAIYLYIEQEIAVWYSDEAETICLDWWAQKNSDSNPQ